MSDKNLRFTERLEKLQSDPRLIYSKKVAHPSHKRTPKARRKKSRIKQPQLGTQALRRKIVQGLGDVY